MLWSKGVMRLIATRVWVALWIAELEKRGGFRRMKRDARCERGSACFHAQAPALPVLGASGWLAASQARKCLDLLSTK
jgi:hypothetical protein